MTEPRDNQYPPELWQYLPELWYLALPGTELKRGQMRSLTMLDQPLVVGRCADGETFALKDICPHRGIPLSDGSFDGCEVECCYHGWRFDRTGVCRHIPSLTGPQLEKIKLEKIRTRAYPAREVQGNIWVYFGQAETPLCDPPQIAGVTAQHYGLAQSMLFDASQDHAVMGLMDPAHGPFVHRAWWWRSKRSIHEKQKRFAPSELGFTMLRHRPSSNSRAYKILGGTPETEISFQLPGVRIEHVQTGKHVMCGLTAVTPVNEHQTHVHHIMYWTMPWLSALRPLVKQFAKMFLGQDRDIVNKQQRGLRSNPNLMLINDADQQARWYLQLKREYLRSCEESRAFKNPVPNATLSWRS